VRWVVGVVVFACVAVAAARPAFADDAVPVAAGAPRCVSSSPSLAGAYAEAFGAPIGDWQAGDVPQAYPLPDGRVLWLLNDSFVDASGAHPGATFLRNVAILQTARCFQALTGPPADDGTATSFLSAFEVKDRGWWWPHGGVVEGDVLRVFFTAMEQTGPPGWAVAWRPKAVAIASYDWRTLRLVDLRLAPDPAVTPAYGFSVASDDDWTYLYGSADRLDFGQPGSDSTQVFVARVRRGQVLTAPAYWNGTGWTPDRSAAVPVSTGTGWAHRLRVYHLGDRWVGVVKEDEWFGDRIVVLEAPEPQGPWTVTQQLRVPSLTGDGATVTYEAGLVPTVLDGDRVVLQWSNNAIDAGDVFADPSRYRPSFADVHLGAPTRSNALCAGGAPGQAGTATPVAGPGAFRPVQPVRLLDTRAAGGAPPAAGTTTVVDVAAAAGVPAPQLRAAVLTVTATDVAGAGYLAVWPSGTSRPATSALNVDGRGGTAASLVTVGVGTDGRVAIYQQAGGHLVVDLAGWYAPADGPVTAGRFVPVTPTRLLDTRSGPRPGPGTTAVVPVAGRAGIPPAGPAGPAAVVVTLTATDVAAPGFLTAWGDGPLPLASNLNVAPGDTRANQAVVPVGADGAIRVYQQPGAHVVVDVVGWYTGADASLATTGRFVPVTPVRLADSRAAAGRPAGGCTASLHAPVPAGTVTPSALALAVTLTDPTRPGYATAYPAGGAVPLASTVNVDRAGQTRPDHALVGTGADGAVAVYLSPATHAVVDLTGWFTP
jgi:hypothetical protein